MCQSVSQSIDWVRFNWSGAKYDAHQAQSILSADKICSMSCTQYKSINYSMWTKNTLFYIIFFILLKTFIFVYASQNIIESIDLYDLFAWARLIFISAFAGSYFHVLYICV